MNLAPLTLHLRPDPPEDTLGFGIKNRYLSFIPSNPGVQTAVRVTLSVYEKDTSLEGQSWWLASPFQVCENSGQTVPQADGFDAYRT